MEINEVRAKAVNIIKALYMGYELKLKDNVLIRLNTSNLIQQLYFNEETQQWVWDSCPLCCDLTFFYNVANNMEQVQYNEVLNYIQTHSFIIL